MMLQSACTWMYYYFIVMEALQSLLLRRGKEETQKSRPRRKAESLQAIFRLPKSVLDKFRTLDSPNVKKEAAEAELGKIGQEYQHNLRRTILNHTKQLLMPSRSRPPEKGYLIKDDPISFKGMRNHNSTQYDSNAKTLTLLQKAIIKQDDLFEVQQNLFQLQVNRLPIIRKRQSKRKKISTFQIKHPSPLPMQKPYNPPLTDRRLEHREGTSVVRAPPVKAQKTDIRGWDIPQFSQF